MLTIGFLLLTTICVQPGDQDNVLVADLLRRGADPDDASEGGQTALW